MKNVYVKNTIILSLFLLLSKFLGALYKIPLSNILGTEGIGLYQMVFPVYSLFLVFITGGMPVYVAQKISNLRAKNEVSQMNKIIKICLIISLFFAVIFALVLLVFSVPIAKLQGNQGAYLGYITVAISILFSAVTCVYRGYFQGLENMIPSAVSGLIEQLVKLCIGLSFSYFLQKYGLIYAVSGAFLGVLVSEIASFIYVAFIYQIKKYKSSKPRYIKFIDIQNSFKEFLPITLTNLILPLSSCLDTFVVVNLLSYSGIDIKTATSLFGIATGMISPLVNFPILLCGTLSVAVLPTLTFKIAKGEDISDIVNGTYFFIWLLCLPCVFGVVGVARNIITIFFPAIEIKFINVSVFYLCILSFNIIWLAFIQISSSILNSFGQFKLPLFSQIIGLIVKFVLLVFLILFSNLNILALGISINISEAIICLINLYFVKKITPLNLQFNKIIVPILSALIMFLGVFIINKYLFINAYLKLAIIFLFAVFVYFLICFTFKIISINQIKNLFNNSKKVNKKINE